MTQAAVTFLHTPDLELTTRFYRDALGLEMVVDQGRTRIFRIAPNAYVGFTQHADPLLEPERVIVGLIADDVQGWYDRLTRTGIPTDGPPRVTPAYGIEHFFAFDPVGYRVEVQRFLREDWAPTAKEGNRTG